MLDTNQTRGPPLEYGFKASVTIRGPWIEATVRFYPHCKHVHKDSQGVQKSRAYQVRATNPNIDHISDCLSSVALPFTTTDPLWQKKKKKGNDHFILTLQLQMLTLETGFVFWYCYRKLPKTVFKPLNLQASTQSYLLS